ncbi:hypothetical protein EX30DRAFT_346141 [Ascodesmis nigricans]|uniref:Uncharacterized protein n=1 Tax=Ascodesmis nigricans TaxID=341454 RepID=A0A4S2N8R7_9PEZI|nr:hypothetical protein EX30DRAFT_346141 [Ascodesmis nigricans]
MVTSHDPTTAHANHEAQPQLTWSNDILSHSLKNFRPSSPVMIPTELFPASSLPQHLQTDVTTGRRRKDRVPSLETCPLVEMAQWNCEADGGVTRCWPVKRWFRR